MNVKIGEKTIKNKASLRRCLVFKWQMGNGKWQIKGRYVPIVNAKYDIRIVE